MEATDLSKEFLSSVDKGPVDLDDPLDISKKDTLPSESPPKAGMSDPIEDFLKGPLEGLDPLKREVSNTISATKDFLADLTAEYAKVEEQSKKEKEKLIEVEPGFAFSKPLPQEPEEVEEEEDEDDEISEFLKAESAPPVPGHRPVPANDSPPMDAFEPSQTPEPDFPPPVSKPSPSPPATTVPVQKLQEERPPTPPPHRTTPPKEETKATVKELDIRADDIFTEYGLDAWFNPERLHPKVESLVYWRDPKKSGAVFGVLMATLLSLAYCSLISVIAYLCLFALTGTIAFRIYKSVMQAVQKTSDGHPFKEWLEMDIGLSEERVREASQAGVERLNRTLVELRRLFLVEDLVDSFKFGILLWALTYVGAWFNGLTLVIIGVIAMFSLPKVYENNKSQIDAYISLATAKISEITNKVKAAVPMGKKDSGEKKDQ